MPTIRANIAASELLTRLRECQVELWVANGSLRYRAPTGAFTPELRACVASLRTEITTLLTEQVAEPLPLSPVQQRLWFEAQLAPMSAAYNIPAAVRMRGPLDLAALEWSLQEVVRRHEALRTTFEVGEDGLPRQKVLPSLAVSLAVVDMSGQSEARLAAERWVELPFDLCRDALIRCRLFRLSANEHVLCVCVHHIVFDLVSQEVRDLPVRPHNAQAGSRAAGARSTDCWGSARPKPCQRRLVRPGHPVCGPLRRQS